MAGFLSEDKSRNVIPRWRDFKQTLALGELNPISFFSKKKTEINSFHHQKKVNDWKIAKTTKNAIELLNSSFILDDEQNSKESAIFLNSSNNKIKPLETLTQQILAPSFVDSPSQANDFDHLDRLIKITIQKLRFFLSNHLNSPISWIELARLYLIIGKENAAEKCILVAIQLAPHNRYVSRISSRFFAHTGDFQKARQILKVNMAFKTDPWLLSAEIGIATLQSKSSFDIKRGIELISTKNYSPFELNELLSAIATADLNAGSVKNSKRLFNESLTNPNDNTLAQAVWAKKHIHDINFSQRNFENIPNIFEAKAYHEFNNKHWSLTMANTLQWFIDQPFSREPAIFGSFLASSVLENFDEAIRLCTYGLKASPGDFTLTNNLAFSYLKKGMIKEGQHHLSKIVFEDLEEYERVVYFATKGLLMYKLNQKQIGEEFYLKAINLSTKIKNHKLKILAEFHHLAIQLEIDGFPSEKLMLLDSLTKEFEKMDEVYLGDIVKNLRKKIANLS